MQYYIKCPVFLQVVKHPAFPVFHSKAALANSNSSWVLIYDGKTCTSRHFLHADQTGNRRLTYWSLGCFCLQILEPGRGTDWRRAVCFLATLSLCLGLLRQRKNNPALLEQKDGFHTIVSQTCLER